MSNRCWNALGFATVFVSLFATTSVYAQSFATRPVRIVSAEVGAASDFLSRLIAPGLSANLGQQVIVDNRGGSGVIPIEVVVKASPDGHTLLVFGATLWLLPFLQTVSYDPVKDLTPVSLVAITPLLVVVHPSVPVKSVKELIALARSKPGSLNYASGISGSATHLPVELFKSMAGVNIVRVAYKGGAPALNSILSGETQVMFATTSAGGPHVKSGRLVALAITTAKPSNLFPGLPTVAESALPGYEGISTQGVFAPARIPAALLTRLNREIVAVLDSREIRDRVFNTGSEVASSTPEQFAAIIREDMTRMGKVIKDAGIRAE